MTIKIKYAKTVLFLCFFAVVFSLLIIYPGASSDGVVSAIKFCGNTIIPSMFPFMVVSTLFTKLNLGANLGNRFENISHKLFKLPSCCIFVFLMSLIGGYPSGAKLVNELYSDKKINTEQANQMMYFSVCSGPGFAFGAVGVKMLNSSDIGLILLFSQVISSVILLIVLSVFSKATEQKNKTDTYTKLSFANALIESSASCVVSVMNMCGLIILFSCVISLLYQSGLIDAISDFLANFGIGKGFTESLVACLLEITTGCNTAVKNQMPIEFIAFFLSFCGICIHFQIFSILTPKISKCKFLTFRIISACISFLCAKIILIFHPIDAQVFFSNTEMVTVNPSQSYFCVLCFLLMSVVFLASVKGKYDILRKSKRAKIKGLKP